ncbi:hypothetical protein [Massilia sp. MS-15]|uniref:hypothetical protein n=1 Tax=Massilia sp. MS-15 TaxID=2878200 RepID=UPI001CD3222C|nr:hypothetical protein [Massilia sp. MS-15]MCA1248736.1 hypothetical protein [Massilia sp. MS-15]
MMTSTPESPYLQTDGRTVREVVEFNQELVNEVWCRRIIRQLLQSLELQYAMGLPHRPITPDTVQVLDSGDPMLLPSSETSAEWSEAGDMHDLAAIVHYAITREYPPEAPLRGRVLGAGEGYSPAFVGAIDRCLGRDPQQRPHNVEELRALFGIVPRSAPVPVPMPEPLEPEAESAQTPMREPASVATPAPATDGALPAAEAAAAAASVPPERPATPAPGAQRHRPILATAAVVLAALAGLFFLLERTETPSMSAPAVPQAAPAQPVDAPPAAAADAPGTANAPAAPAAEADAVDAAGETTAGSVPAADGANYKLVIKPWGMVEVDGVNRGPSPPLKRLTLAPGTHTIRILNPSFPEHTVTVNAVKGTSPVIELDFTEEEAP